MRLQMLDLILLPELKKQHEVLWQVEQNLSVGEKKDKHKVFVSHGELIISLVDIARKEGILALDEARDKLNDILGKKLLKDLIVLIVDGTDPEMVARIALMNYFVEEQDPYIAIINIMSIYGILSIQAGEDPGLIQRMMQTIVFEDIFEQSSKYLENSKLNETKKDIDIERLCKGKMRIKERCQGYFELSLCEELLMAMDNSAIQRVLRDLNDYTFPRIVQAFSGEARKCIFQNLSKRKVEELAQYIRYDDRENESEYYIDDKWNLRNIKEAATEMLKIIHRLEMQGEIAIVKGETVRFLSMIMQQIANDEKALKERKHDCDLLIRMLESYSRYTFDNL